MCPGRTLFNPNLFGAEYRVAARCQFSPAGPTAIIRRRIMLARSLVPTDYSARNNRPQSSCCLCAYTSAVTAAMVGVFSDELPSAAALRYCVRHADNEKPRWAIFGVEYRVTARCHLSPARSHCDYSAPNNARPVWCHRLFRAE